MSLQETGTSVVTKYEEPHKAELTQVEALVRRYVEVPHVEETVVEVQRTVEVEKIVPKVEYREVVREVEIPEIVIREKIEEYEEVQNIIRRIPKIETVEVERVIEKPVPGPVEERYVEQIIHQKSIVEVPKPVYVKQQYLHPVFHDQEVPLIVLEKIRPVISFNPKERTTIKLKRYHPKIVPVDIQIEISPDELLRRLGVNTTTIDDLDVWRDTAEREARLGCGSDFDSEASSEYSLTTYHTASEITAVQGVEGVRGEGRRKDYGCGKVHCCGKGREASAATRRHFGYVAANGVKSWMEVKARRVTLEEVKEATKRDNITCASSIGETGDAHYNSWLLNVNYHLVDDPDVMKSVPWRRDLNGNIPFLPPGTRLSGTLMGSTIAQHVGVRLPPIVPVILSGQVPCHVDSEHVTLPVGPIRQSPPQFNVAEAYQAERIKAHQKLEEATRASR